MKRINAFTLIEILIALVIFSIIATLTSAILYQSYNSRDRVNTIADKFNEMQLAFALIERDTYQMIPRTVLGNDMLEYSEFIGTPTAAEFTRAGFANPGQKEQRAALQRISYYCSNDKLIRRNWFELDTLNRARFQEKILLSNLESCHFDYYNRNLQVLENWRPQQAKVRFAGPRPELLPCAIKMHFRFKNRGNIELLFIIPEAIYANLQA